LPRIWYIWTCTRRCLDEHPLSELAVKPSFKLSSSSRILHPAEGALPQTQLGLERVSRCSCDRSLLSRKTTPIHKITRINTNQNKPVAKVVELCKSLIGPQTIEVKFNRCPNQ